LPIREYSFDESCGSLLNVGYAKILINGKFTIFKTVRKIKRSQGSYYKAYTLQNENHMNATTTKITWAVQKRTAHDGKIIQKPEIQARDPYQKPDAMSPYI
jgi:hypothetical protein